ncbi:MAG TPA: BamA/TamA family outer membrane protein, partial [Vicinamibacterales bacterium]|nr:BamA/TamA family outer membrane protein [Vicinamibacterales bacterium]
LSLAAARPVAADAPPAQQAARADAPPATRAEAIAQTRAAKAERLQPYRPGTLEKALLKIENDRLIEQLLAGRGGTFYLRWGFGHSGAGHAIGPGLQWPNLLGGRLQLRTDAVASLKRYWDVRARAALPELAGGRVFVEIEARRRSMPQEDFFGLGPASRRPDRVSFRLDETRIGGTAGVRLPPLGAGGGLEFLDPGVGRGRDRLLPSIEERFDDVTAPGLAEQPRFLVYRAFGEIDYARPAGNPRRGGRYLVTASRYSDRDLGRYSFDRLDVDLRQYLPFLQERRVIVLRGLVSLSSPDVGARVPFYLQRTLGGHNTLRGFRDYRFRDTHLLLLQAEYRWEILPALDAALFYDTGKVVPRARDLSLRDLERDWGFGFRFGTNAGVFLRIDAAFGSRDGPHLFIKFSNVF